MQIMSLDFIQLQLIESSPQRHRQVWLLSTSMLIWCVRRYWRQPPQLWGGNDRLVAPAGTETMSTIKKLGLAWMLATGQRHAEMDTAKELWEDRVGAAKTQAVSTLLRATCSKKPQASRQRSCAHPSLTPCRNAGLDFQMGVADGGSFITQTWR